MFQDNLAAKPHTVTPCSAQCVNCHCRWPPHDALSMSQTTCCAAKLRARCPPAPGPRAPEPQAPYSRSCKRACFGYALFGQT